MITLDPQQLKGKSACILLAEWFEALSAKLKAGEDPTLRLAANHQGEVCIMEFRAVSVPGCFERITVSPKVKGRRRK